MRHYTSDLAASPDASSAVTFRFLLTKRPASRIDDGNTARDFHAKGFREPFTVQVSVCPRRVEIRHGGLQRQHQRLAALVRRVECASAVAVLWSFPADGLKLLPFQLHQFNRQMLHNQPASPA